MCSVNYEELHQVQSLCLSEIGLVLTSSFLHHAPSHTVETKIDLDELVADIR